MTYLVNFTPQAEKDLACLDKIVSQNIANIFPIHLRESLKISINSESAIGELSTLLTITPILSRYMLLNIAVKYIKYNSQLYGIKPAISISEQKLNLLFDLTPFDDIVFDILGLTENERNEVYCAIC